MSRCVSILLMQLVRPQSVLEHLVRRWLAGSSEPVVPTLATYHTQDLVLLGHLLLILWGT
jgi:hypothetical protein